MVKAYLLVNTERGSESQVLEALKKVEGVEKAHNLIGVYDIIASIKSDSMDKLKIIITKIVGENEKLIAKHVAYYERPKVSPCSCLHLTDHYYVFKNSECANSL